MEISLVDKRLKPKTKELKEQISVALKGRTPWNKGIGLEDPRIRKGIKTRKELAALRQLIRLLYAKEV